MYDVDESQRLLGDTDPWTRYLPQLWRAATGVRGALPISVEPRPEDNDTLAGAAFWGPLLDLLDYRLGWSEPAAGMRKWWELGLPAAESTLIALRDFYGDQLVLAVEWLLRDDIPEDVVEQARLRRQRGRCHELMNEGGWDPFHLTGHTGRPGDLYPEGPPWPGQQPLWDGAESSALVVPSYRRWYGFLQEWSDNACGVGPQEGLTPPVDVIVEPIGWLGRFVRSPATGRLHATDERVHLWGNPLSR